MSLACDRAQSEPFETQLHWENSPNEPNEWEQGENCAVMKFLALTVRFNYDKEAVPANPLRYHLRLLWIVEWKLIAKPDEWINMQCTEQSFDLVEKNILNLTNMLVCYRILRLCETN